MSIAQWVDQLSESVSYGLLFLVTAFSGLGVPEEVPLLFAGLQVAEGDVIWWRAWLTVTPALLLRDTVGWLVGHHLGGRLLESAWFAKTPFYKAMSTARDSIASRGNRAILFCRFSVGVRLPMFIVAGASGVPFRVFLGWDLLGALVSIPVTMALGYAFGPALLDNLHWLPVIGGLLITGVVLRFLWSRKREKGS